MVASCIANLHTKRVYDPPSEDDGTRVLVDRLWPRGLNKQKAAVNLWLKDVAPSTLLRQWFGHNPVRWEEFQKLYREELSHNEESLRHLRDLLKKGTVTLLYAAHDIEHNHAVVLASCLRDYMKRCHAHDSS